MSMRTCIEWIVYRNYFGRLTDLWKQSKWIAELIIMEPAGVKSPLAFQIQFFSWVLLTVCSAPSCDGLKKSKNGLQIKFIKSLLSRCVRFVPRLRLHCPQRFTWSVLCHFRNRKRSAGRVFVWFVHSLKHASTSWPSDTKIANNLN